MLFTYKRFRHTKKMSEIPRPRNLTPKQAEAERIAATEGAYARARVTGEYPVADSAKEQQPMAQPEQDFSRCFKDLDEQRKWHQANCQNQSCVRGAYCAGGTNIGMAVLQDRKMWIDDVLQRVDWVVRCSEKDKPMGKSRYDSCKVPTLG